MGLQAAMVVAMVAASCDGVAMANAEARRLASSDVTQAILPPKSRACRAVPRGAALVVAQPVSGWLRETWAHEDTARGSDFLSDTPLRAGPPGSALSQREELSSCVPAWPSVVDGWMATTEPPKIEARRKVPRGAASATAPPAASWWRETCTRDFTARGSDLHTYSAPCWTSCLHDLSRRTGLLFFSEERTRETFSFASIEGLRRGRRGGCVGGARRGEGRGVCRRAGWNSGAVGKERVGGGL